MATPLPPLDQLRVDRAFGVQAVGGAQFRDAQVRLEAWSYPRAVGAAGHADREPSTVCGSVARRLGGHARGHAPDGVRRDWLVDCSPGGSSTKPDLAPCCLDQRPHGGGTCAVVVLLWHPTDFAETGVGSPRLDWRGSGPYLYWLERHPSGGWISALLLDRRASLAFLASPGAVFCCGLVLCCCFVRVHQCLCPAATVQR